MRFVYNKNEIYGVLRKCSLMELTRTTIPIGLDRPVKVLHITDTHLPLCEKDDAPQFVAAAARRGAPDTVLSALDEQLSYANAHCDLLLHTGDLIDFASKANLAFLRNFLQNEKVLFAPGNHEYWRSDGGFEDMAYRMDSFARMGDLGTDLFFTSRVVGGVNFVGLDDAYHQVEAWQIERLKAEVGKGLPVVLFLHAPLFQQQLYTRSVAYWHDGTAYLVGCDDAHTAQYSTYGIRTQRPTETTKAFADYVNGEPRIKAVIAGHVHFNFESRLPGGTTQYVTGCSRNGTARLLTFI